MAQIPPRVSDIVKRFIDELEKNHIPVKRAVLFGSYATGTYNQWSDIDLAIVSDVFEGDRFRDRGRIRAIKLAISNDLEPLPYRPVDFKIENPFIKKIIETGVPIKGSIHTAEDK